MGISTFTSKEFVIFCRVSKIGNIEGLDGKMVISQGKMEVFECWNRWDVPNHHFGEVPVDHEKSIKASGNWSFHSEKQGEIGRMGTWGLWYLAGWWFGTWMLWLSIQLGMSYHHWGTHSIIFQRARRKTTNQMNPVHHVPETLAGGAQKPASAGFFEVKGDRMAVKNHGDFSIGRKLYLNWMGFHGNLWEFMGILSDDLTVSYGTAPFLLSMKSSNKKWAMVSIAMSVPLSLSLIDHWHHGRGQQDLQNKATLDWQRAAESKANWHHFLRHSVLSLQHLPQSLSTSDAIMVSLPCSHLAQFQFCF